MKKDVKVNKSYNEEYGEIVESIVITKTKDDYLEDNTLNKSVFHYEVSSNSGIFNDDIGYCTMSWEHSNPIDYTHFHYNIVPLDWALDTLGFDMLEDEIEWKDKYSNDKEFASELATRIEYLRPISEKEYVLATK